MDKIEVQNLESADQESFVVVDNSDKNIEKAADELDNNNKEDQADSSFEEIHSESVHPSVEAEDKVEAVMDVVEDCDVANESCNDNIRQVLDDVESQIEQLRESLSKLVKEKDSLNDVLEGIHQSLPDTELSLVEKEEISLEVVRLRGRVEDMQVKVVTRRTRSQMEAKKVLESEMMKLVKEVEQGGDNSEQLCRSYLAACGGDSSEGVTNHKFEKLILDCNVEDQKSIRLRLKDILQNIIVLKQDQPVST